MPSQTTSDDPIRHIVLLGLENHSFDQMLGCFTDFYPHLEGVDRVNSRINNDKHNSPFHQKETTERQMRLDPMHDTVNVLRQLSKGNSGFVLDYSLAYPQSDDQQRQNIMGYYPMGFLPALHTLARDFTICDHWFSSVPGPTWANRFFLLSGTSKGRVNMPDGLANLNLHLYDQPTLFDRLNEAGVPWKVYFHDFPLSWTLAHQLEPHNAARYFPVEQFYHDAGETERDFPAFCFLEPRYNGIDQNDDHPPHDVMKAQKLIADVFNALRSNGPLWNSTLLVVLYDEHGGFYDHVPPPEGVLQSVAPDDHQEEYSFDRLGVRVPALLVSPWVDRTVDQTVFDHTSLLRYLTDKWSLGSLGQRVQQANSIGRTLRTSGVPRTDTVRTIELTREQMRPPDAAVERETSRSLNALHRSLVAFGQNLKIQLDLEAPRVLSGWARFLLQLRSRWVGFWKRFVPHPGQYEAVNLNVPAFLKLQRVKAQRQLAETILDPVIGDITKAWAMRVLEDITGKALAGRADAMKLVRRLRQ